MSLLQITKRAASAEEGQALIDRSLNMCDPLGVPTLFFSSQDMDRIRTLGENGIKTIATEIFGVRQKRLMHFLELQGKSPLEKMLIAANLQNEFVKIVKDEITGLQVPHNLSARLCAKDFQKTAEMYGNGTYVPPLGNMVFRSGEISEMTFFDYVNVQRLNGADRFHNIWHENAHGLGTGEPQSDLIASIITRQSYETSDAINMWADERALTTILYYDKKDMSGVYGWGCVDANDFVAAQPEEKILGLSEAQIRDLRFHRFDPLTETIEKVGRAIRNSGIVIEKRENLYDLAMYAANLATDQFKDDEVAQYIAKRFALASTRAFYGEKIYRTAPDLDLPQGVYPSFIDEPEI